MSMVYLYDLVFVAVFLSFKQFMKYTQDTDLKLFEFVRNYGFWFEFSFILLAMYFAPYHTEGESAVSFGLCLCTKGVFDYVMPDNYRKNKNCKQ